MVIFLFSQKAPIQRLVLSILFTKLESSKGFGVFVAEIKGVAGVNR